MRLQTEHLGYFPGEIHNRCASRGELHLAEKRVHILCDLRMSAEGGVHHHLCEGRFHRVGRDVQGRQGRKLRLNVLRCCQRQLAHHCGQTRARRRAHSMREYESACWSTSSCPHQNAGMLFVTNKTEQNGKHPYLSNDIYIYIYNTI